MKYKRWASLSAVILLCLTALGLPSVALSSDNTPDIGTMPAVLTRITVSPVSPSVVSGQTERFTAQGLDQEGNVITGVVFIWGIANTQKDAGSIDSDTGVFTAGTTPGTYKDAIEAKSDNVTGTASVTVTPAALAIANVLLVDGQEGVDYSYTLVAAGGTSPYTWSIIAGSLPDGLSLSGDTISGTPTTVGTSSFTTNVTDSTSPTPQTVTKDLSITISPAALTTSDNTTEITSDNTTETTSFIVRLVAGLSETKQQQVIARDGGVETSSVLVLNIHFIKVPDASADEVIQRYESDPQVRSIERDKVRKVGETSSDPSYPDQWVLPKISWDSVFGSVIPTGSSVIAILDTGIDASHPDLSGLVLSGYSTFEGSDAQTDPNGHGTKMAGIAAALTNNGIGVAGVAYAGVSLLPIQVLSPDGTGQDSDIIRGIVWAVDHGANVILMAFSNPDYSPTLQEAIDYAWDHGVILVAAAGNDGLSTVTYPAGDRGVIGVSATDSNDALVSSSNYGQIVFLAAPGVNLLTTGLDGTYTAVSGTSAAAAVVAGAAAFMHAVDPSLSNGEIVGRLARAADPVGTQEQTGNGRLNMARALSNTGTAPVEPAGASPLGDGGPYVGPYVAAAIITSTATGGAWTTGGTWVGGVAPTSTDSVVIATTGANSVTTGGSRTCAGITINSGATLSMANGNVLTVNGNVSGAGTWTGTGATATISLTGDWSFNGIITGTANGVTLAGTGTQSIAGFTTTGTVSMTKTGGTATFTGNVNGGALTINGSGGTLNLGTGLTHTFTGTWTRTNGTLDCSSSTLNLGGSVSGTGGTFTASTGTVTLNGSGAQSIAATTFYNLTTSGSGTKTLGGSVTVNGNLTIGSGTGFTVGAYSFTVTGATSITGTLTISSTTGTKTFGDITINNGGTMTFTAAEAVTMNGNLQNDGTFSGTTGTWTFQKTGGGGTISGGSSITVATVTFATDYTNSGTFTVTGTLTVTGVTLTNNGTITATGALSGTGGLTNTGTLNLGGTSGITTLTATASGNTVNYNGAAQTVKATTYHHLTTSGSGTKTLAGATTVNGDLTVGSGTTLDLSTYTANGASSGGTITVAGTLKIGGTNGFPSNYTTHTLTEGTVAYSGTGQTVSAETYNNLTTSGSGTKTLAGTTTVNGDLTVGSGTTLDLSTYTANRASSGGTITVAGTLKIGGTNGFPGNYTTHTLTGGTVEYSGTGQTVSVETYNNLTTSGSGTKTLAGTTTVNGNLAIGASTTLDVSSNNFALNVGGNWSNSGTFTPQSGTVTLNGSGAQSIAATTFYNLTTSGSGTKTLSGTVTVNGNLTVGSGTGFTVGAYSLTVTGATSITGTLTISSTTGTKTFGDITINNGGTMTFTAAEAVTMNGNLQNDGTFSGTTGTWTFQKTGGGGTISGGSSITVATVTFATAYTNSGTFTVTGTLTVTGVTLTNNGTITATGALSGTGGLTNTGTLNLGGTSAITTLTATASGNTVNYNGAAQTVKATTYHHLTTSGSGTKTLAGATTVNGDLTIGASTTLDVSSNNFALNVGGNWNNSGTFTPRSGTVTLNGSGAQSIDATTFYNLTLNNSNAFTINNNIIINGTLNFTSGNIITGANTVIIGSGGSISRNSGHVVGNLQKYVATGTASLTFEVGTASNYNPVTVAFGNVTVAGNLTVKVTSGQHPNFGTSIINSSKYVNEYWSLTNSGVVFNNFSAIFTFVSGDILGGADPSNFIVGEYSGGWTYPTVGTKTATSTQATGISSFGDFCIGEPGNPPTVNSVALVDTSMTPQTQYTVTVNVSNAGGKNALNTLVLKLWYDSSGSDHSESTFDSRTADTQNCAIITWTQSTDSFNIQPSSSTTWVLGTCSSPGSLPGDFIFRFTVGKVATETSGSARWQVAAKVSNNVSQTGFNYDSTPPTMNWYGEITVNTVNITWINTAALGSGFTDDTTNRVTNISLTFICNGNYNVQAKAISLWSGNGKTVVLAATDTPGNGEIALKADDDATLSGAVLIISTGYTTFGTGTQTGEGGNTVSNNSLWLKLGSSGIPDVQYSGTIYYSITP